MLDITSANAVVAISVESLFSVNLENFSADSAFTTDTVQARKPAKPKVKLSELRRTKKL